MSGGAKPGNKNAEKHGKCYTREYQAWGSMRQRVLNKNHKHFKDYGGRGITICERWEQFENFESDMGPRPQGMSLDRKKNEGNYEPGNCRWATQTQQINNTRVNRKITYNGETRNMVEWARHFGLKPATLKNRVRKGEPLDQLFRPPDRYKRRALNERRKSDKAAG